MKNKALAALSAIIIMGMGACKEVGPVIDLGDGPVAADSTYVAAVPAAQQRVVLVEEFTGAKCANCPKARDLLTGIVNQHPERILPIEIHIFNFAQSEPATHEGGKYDLRTQDGTDLGKQFYVNVNQMPSAGINRTGIDAERLLLSAKWANTITSALATPPPANVTVQSAYDDANRTATIKVQVAYTQAVSKQQFLSLAIIEDDIVDVQEYPDSFDHEYTFMHTLRDFVTPVTGQPFLNDLQQKEAGRVYERTFTYVVNDAWKPENCKVIAFVHNNDADSKEVLQAAEVKLKP